MRSTLRLGLLEGEFLVLFSLTRSANRTFLRRLKRGPNGKFNNAQLAKILKTQWAVIEGLRLPLFAD